MCVQCAAGTVSAAAAVGGAAGLRAWLGTRQVPAAVLRLVTVVLLLAATLAAGLLA